MQLHGDARTPLVRSAYHGRNQAEELLRGWVERIRYARQDGDSQKDSPDTRAHANPGRSSILRRALRKLSHRQDSQTRDELGYLVGIPLSTVFLTVPRTRAMGAHDQL